jgi:hypothetical protein
MQYRLLIAFAIAWLSQSAAGGVLVYLGGSPLTADRGHYFLNNHGDLTEVTYVAWTLARASEVVLVLGWISALFILLVLAISGMRLIVSRDSARYSEDTFGARFRGLMLLPVLIGACFHLIALILRN